MIDFIREFEKSLQTGFIDKSVLSNAEFQPDLLINQKLPPQKVLTTIIQELEQCDEFFISVAFVTTSGVATIINQLKDLEAKGVKGKLLVSQYLNFTQPEALRRFLQFENIDLRILVSDNAHSKGYIFRQTNCYNIIVGSSNLTAQALSTNKEWNIKVSALNDSGFVTRVINEFHSDFEKGIKVSLDFIENYEDIYKSQFLVIRQNNSQRISSTLKTVSPNLMQQEALNNLDKIRLEGKNKALIISATGTGKTFLSAFDAKAYNPKKLLFVVHRLTIAKNSLDTFKTVFGPDKSMGLYSGDFKDLNADFIFSTVQTISKSKHLDSFSPDHFDYIIIDETHRSSADSYLRLIQFFKPKFLLGMTATPERTDGNEIFSLFDHNIAYEIRLNKAMEQEMLSSFHYYGVTDISVNKQVLDNKADFRTLVANERVQRIIENAQFYGSDNGITRGLIFCSKKEEAIELSNLFNEQGFSTVALTDKSTKDQRETAIEKLGTDNLSEKLDYIFTVDIFNEGIDIPKVNQIIMLRPTQSAIIFIQQLGRGLRKVDGKSYLTVLDFIGNYENNYLIPVALYGDTSYNKDNLRKLITEGSRLIPGSSTINFDKITKEKIFQSIDTANMRTYSDLKNDYNLLKFRLGKRPMMMDFIEHGSRDPFLYVEYANSYYNFYVKLEKLEPLLTQKQQKLLELFSKEINNSKRIEECIILKSLIESGHLTVEELIQIIKEKYQYSISIETIKSCVSNLNFEFVREKKDNKLLSVREIYNLQIINFVNNVFSLTTSFIEDLQSADFKLFLLDSTAYSIYEFDRQFDHEKWQNGFLLYRKYSRKDVFRILNVAENPIAQNVGGYLVSSDNSHCPIFVNYHKDDDISESTKYHDEFVNNKEFDWMSKSNRTLNSSDVQSILGQKGPIRLPLFIKKNNDEGLEFYYMGEISPKSDNVSQTTILNDNGEYLPVVKIRFDLVNPVAPNLYKYLHEKISSHVKKKEKSLENNDKDSNQNLENKGRNLIPLYNFYAAAGSFSDMQSNKDFQFIDGPEKGSKDFFACEIVGDSMNRVIPNGSICLFKYYTGGSRNGKIVLVENRDIQDEDFNSAFTIKTYSSDKSFDEDGNFKHEMIVLRPNSYNSNYQDILITEDNAEGMRVIGEFIRVLKSPTVD